jgi:hypothetical protein
MAPVGDVGQHLQSEAGQAGLDRGVTTDEPGVASGEPEGADSADVLAGEMHGSEVEMLDQLPQAFSCEGARVVARLVSGVAEAGEVDGDDAVLGGESAG